ncbi:hypothetical protein TNIN_230091 [Trichonephila inaurata madagascariensis]|uniref:Uncharacterized protein n=1 Tax=Trichonephila inaurata madagascariensis TaxID=2747483 RepID=A0A8X6X9U9_9ARAC|nr:hypothetical protein TNIN_230091 [Trichonephila inaurata madagascariensis]
MWLSRKSFPSKPEYNWGRGGIFTCFPHAVSECDLADFCLAAGNPARQHTSALLLQSLVLLLSLERLSFLLFCITVRELLSAPGHSDVPSMDFDMSFALHMFDHD